MPFPWEILIALTVLLAAYLLKGLADGIVDGNRPMSLVLLGYAALYGIAAAAIYWISPPVVAKAHVHSIVRALMPEKSNAFE